MFARITGFITVCSAMFALTACGGGSPEVETQLPVTHISAAAEQAIQTDSAAVARMSGSATPAVGATIVSKRGGGAHRIAVLDVSEDQRVADELSTLDYEQSFSMEMNRRHDEQAELALNEARAAGHPVRPCHGRAHGDADACASTPDTAAP